MSKSGPKTGKFQRLVFGNNTSSNSGNAVAVNPEIPRPLQTSPLNVGAALNSPNEDNDDDCILIPENIETVDLCNLSQQQIVTNFFPPYDANEVIEIAESPVVKKSKAGNSSGKSLADTKSRLSYDDGHSKGLEINCPVCLESVVKRFPVSTVCGHLFCKICIEGVLTVSKECPICKRSLSLKNAFHSIFL